MVNREDWLVIALYAQIEHKKANDVIQCNLQLRDQSKQNEEKLLFVGLKLSLFDSPSKTLVEIVVDW